MDFVFGLGIGGNWMISELGFVSSSNPPWIGWTFRNQALFTIISIDWRLMAVSILEEFKNVNGFRLRVELVSMDFRVFLREKSCFDLMSYALLIFRDSDVRLV